MQNLASLPETMQEAVKVYLARKNRTEHPDGKFDNARRWYPGEQERQPCCCSVRSPSRSYPYNLMTHCRSVVHIANLFNTEIGELKKAINSDISVCSSRGFKKRCNKCRNRFICFTNRGQENGLDI